MTAPVFDLATWRVRFPQFAASSDALVELYAAEAPTYIYTPLNDDCVDLATRSVYLNFVVAHIAALNALDATGASLASPLVGRIGQASQGSVSVRTDWRANPSQQEAFFTQTPYGAQLWTMLQGYMVGRYVPGPQPFYQSPYAWYGGNGVMGNAFGTGSGWPW